MTLLGAQCVHGFIYPVPLLNTNYMLSTMPGTMIYKPPCWQKNGEDIFHLNLCLQVLAKVD